MTDKLEKHDDVIEVFTDYKTGMRTLATATAEMKKLGFEEGVARALLKAMKRGQRHRHPRLQQGDPATGRGPQTLEGTRSLRKGGE